MNDDGFQRTPNLLFHVTKQLQMNESMSHYV